MKRIFLTIGLLCLVFSNAYAQTITVKKLSGTIELISYEGGILFLDDKELGEIPASSSVTISDSPIGNHVLVLHAKNGRRVTRQVIVRAGQTSFIQIDAPDASMIRIGLVTDLGGIDDQSFNQGTWEGIERLGKDLELQRDRDYTYLQSSTEADYVPNLRTFADEKLDLIVAPGFLFEKAVEQVARDYPLCNFLIIDSVVQKPNVVSAVFAEHEGSFLVGVVAGLKAKAAGKTIVGFLGGMQFPLIEKFQAGFEQGVKAVIPGATVLVDYAGDFADMAIGQDLARKQFEYGAYIIYHAAGFTGYGMIKEAKERSAKGDIRWAIGVDVDQYADGLYGDTSAVLTSMIKRVDVAAYDIAKRALMGNFPGGELIVYGLKDGGMSLPDENPNLDPALLAEAEQYVRRVIAGNIVVAEVP